MKVVQINTFPYKATGSIMMNLHRFMLSKGIDSYVVWGRGRNPENDHEISIEDKLGIKWHGLYTRLTDKTGFASQRATKDLVKKLEEIKPDIIHLHNLHGYYINLEILFSYIKEKNIKTIWTLHDCWAFTGHCAYFDAVSCDKWKGGCYNCEQLETYPASKILDNSKWNWKKKKELFKGLNITIVTPSNWLADLVQQSFLSEYPTKVIHNGIDLNIFNPTTSDFRKNSNLTGKFIILGVASEWTERKGLRDFIRLDEMLNDNYKIVIVGLTKKQINQVPDSIIAIERTNNLNELVELYTTADIFFNPTYEDNFPTTNLEALACGTPVCTYRTGGSPESVDENCGIVLEQGEVEQFAHLLNRNVNPKFGKNFDVENVMSKFKKEDMLEKYIYLYDGIEF
ncbi:Glycosyltransferase involved in cell wall bisynthesis [Bacillus sp. OV166]|uniref:glycosyltransferase n=1 Tax=Bacillus sp. OV166 TaxID=1882763 RepID=UPI000A2AEF9D|nr:glycosyltransferase [Bacillus sp. OV166]SMQ85074.1 Glycosyltransferase involved in cell wall bisynthesis [Bacillus sp. OV166]